jgi:hypothetical protein
MTTPIKHSVGNRYQQNNQLRQRITPIRQRQRIPRLIPTERKKPEEKIQNPLHTRVQYPIKHIPRDRLSRFFY